MSTATTHTQMQDYRGGSSAMRAHGGLLPGALIKRELHALYKECEKWAKKVEDENLEFKVKIADAAVWGPTGSQWEGLWVADDDPTGAVSDDVSDDDDGSGRNY